MKKIIILLGPPGCGKGTQAKKIAAKYGYGNTSSGSLLRALKKSGKMTEEEKEAIKGMEEGKLVPDWLVYKLVFAEVKRFFKEGKNGAILDGATRTKSQAEEFYNHFKDAAEIVAIEVAISDSESMDRLTKRRMCRDCQEIIPWTPDTYHIKKCPKCEGELETRPDDELKIIQNRIVEQGNKALKPVLDFYKKLGILKVVDGMGTIEEVNKKIEEILNEKYVDKK